MNIISLIIHWSELALCGIILYFVVAMISMPANMIKVCQGLIILILVLFALNDIAGGQPQSMQGTTLPSISAPKSIIK